MYQDPIDIRKPYYLTPEEHKEIARLYSEEGLTIAAIVLRTGRGKVTVSYLEDGECHTRSQ